MLTHFHASSEFLERLGPVVLPAWQKIATDNAQVQHVRSVFGQSWARSMPLPLDALPRGQQKVALASATGRNEERLIRPGGHATLHAAYRERARTRVWESVNSAGADWTALATVHLAGLLRRRVLCTLYHSVAGDDSLGPHDDQWWGIITQLRGAKRWRIWDRPDDAPTNLVMSTGDVLLLPAGIPHQVWTPRESVHMVLAVTSHPLITV